MAKEKERLSLSFKGLVTKVESESGIVEAIVSVTGVVDYHEDVILSGAFAKTIAERGRKIQVLNQHDTWTINSVIGICLEMREIGRDELPIEIQAKYPEATGGLWTKTRYLLNTPEGAGAFTRIAEGAISEYSIGFEIMLDEWKDMGNGLYLRIIKEIRLWEYSPVIWGANPATATVGVKALTENITTGIEQLAERLQMEHKAGRVINAANAEKLRLAAQNLLAVLESAGIPLDSADTVEDDEGSKAKAGPQSETPPAPTPIQRDAVTEEKRQALLAKLKQRA